MIRILVTSAVALGLSGLAFAQETPVDPKAAPKTPAAPIDPAVIKKDSSYALGYRTGDSFSHEYGQYGLGASDIDPEPFVKGFMAALNGGKPEVSDEKLRDAMSALVNLLQKRETELATKNLEDGKKFLEENGKKSGIITTKSGLQYEVLQKGGDKKYVTPKEGDETEKEFLVNYRGLLIDGTEFDASEPGKPASMNLDVIDGFKEAITTMPIGAKWKLFIPSSLAYGDKRRSAEIGPNQTLVFELELVDIKDAPKAPGGAFPFPIPQGGDE